MKHTLNRAVIPVSVRLNKGEVHLMDLPVNLTRGEARAICNVVMSYAPEAKYCECGEELNEKGKCPMN